MRMGKFYEFVGRDAVVVVELLNLNAMGLRAGDDDGVPAAVTAAAIAPAADLRPPMAGFPSVCVRTETARLCRLGLEVVVCEQAAPGAGSGKLLSRFVAQICTPHSPFYVWGDEASEPAGLGDARLTIWGERKGLVGGLKLRGFSLERVKQGRHRICCVVCAHARPSLAFRSLITPTPPSTTR